MKLWLWSLLFLFCTQLDADLPNIHLDRKGTQWCCGCLGVGLVLGAYGGYATHRRRTKRELRVIPQGQQPNSSIPVSLEVFLPNETLSGKLTLFCPDGTAHFSHTFSVGETLPSVPLLGGTKKGCPVGEYTLTLEISSAENDFLTGGGIILNGEKTIYFPDTVVIDTPFQQKLSFYYPDEDFSGGIS